MLDDLKLIHQRDTQDTLGVAEKQSQQLLHDFKVKGPAFEAVQNVVIGGMGGSALAAVYLHAWPGVSVPYEAVHDYELPSYVSDSTLFIACSYSGNTEETLSGLEAADKAGAKIVVITAGGKLAEIAKQKGYPLLEMPPVIQPRMSTFYFLAGLLQILEPAGLVPAGSLAELRASAEFLSEKVKEWRPDVAIKQNPAKRLALELIGKSVVVYSGPKLFPAANKFKICLNENAKNVAWLNQYPELNHNEFIGWSSHPTQKPYAVVEIRSKLEHPRTQKRFEVTERLLSGRRPAPEVVEPQGESLIQQLLWTSVFGDFVSIYVAILNGVNPAPVELVEKLKQLLDE